MLTHNGLRYEHVAGFEEIIFKIFAIFNYMNDILENRITPAIAYERVVPAVFFIIL